MILPLTGSINKLGHLEVGGCDVIDLAKKYGTPLYVLDEKDIRERCGRYRSLFKSKYPNSEVIFASKALCATGVLKIISEEGLGVDVSSGGELFTALKASFNTGKIYFHGNNKTRSEIEEGLAASVGRFVVDNLSEIDIIDELSVKKGKKTKALIRVNPGVEAHTHEAVKTGQTDSKFGIPKESVLDAIKKITGTRNIKFVGLHAHIGSQIFDSGGFLTEIDVLTELAGNIRDKLGIDVEEINIGGGLGIKYVEGDDPASLEDIAEAITKRVKEKVAEFRLKVPKLVLEPGRSIVGTAGVTLYTVGYVKEIPGIRKYLIVDGGMSDNPRPMLYGSIYEFAAADSMNAERTEKVTIAGRFCESGDVLAKDVLMPKVSAGSVIAVLCTGAYNYSMSSNYNRVTRPAMVLVSEGRSRVIVKRESYEDITRNDNV